MRFGILGPLEVCDGGGRPIALRHPVERRLLLRLLIADGEPVPVERLAADVGGPALSLPAVFDRIAGLRRRLEPARAPGAPGRVLVTTAHGYALAVDGAHRDDVEAARLVAAARAELAADRAGAAAERAAEALTLWRGPALVDAGDGPWAAGERERLAALAADARLVATAALAIARPADARAALAESRMQRPHDGRLWALAAAVELALEHDVEALRLLRRARLVLEADGVADRGPALRAMEAAVVQADHHAARQVCRRIALGDLVGRDLESPSVTGGAPGHQIGVGCDLVSEAVTGGAPGHRMRELPGRTRRLVELLAVTVTDGDGGGGEGDDGGGGGAVEIGLLARAAGLPPTVLADHLDPAVALGLVAVEPSGVRFRQRAAADAVLGDLTPFRRRCARRLVDQAAGAVGFIAS